MSWISLLTVFGLALGIFLLVIFGMAVGVILGRRRLSGSCGGLANRTASDGSSNCSLCSNSDNACQELERTMNTTTAADSDCDSHDQDHCPKDCVAEGCTEEKIATCSHAHSTDAISHVAKERG